MLYGVAAGAIEEEMRSCGLEFSGRAEATEPGRRIGRSLLRPCGCRMNALQRKARLGRLQKSGRDGMLSAHAV